jgi:hypothetical protein
MADAPTGDDELTLPTPGRGLKRPVSIERSVDEGVIIASAAVTMDVKNYIIVEAIREGHPYDHDDVMAAVRRELLALANENDSSAQRGQPLAVDVQTPAGADNDSEGYQVDDHPTLTKRGIIHVMLAAELARLSEDDEFVGEVAERARKRAWAEVGDAVSSRLLDSLPAEPDPFYDDDKEARVRALFNINLRALEKQAKRRGHHRGD